MNERRPPRTAELKTTGTRNSVIFEPAPIDREAVGEKNNRESEMTSRQQCGIGYTQTIIIQQTYNTLKKIREQDPHIWGF